MTKRNTTADNPITAAEVCWCLITSIRSIRSVLLSTMIIQSFGFIMVGKTLWWWCRLCTNRGANILEVEAFWGGPTSTWGSGGRRVVGGKRGCWQPGCAPSGTAPAPLHPWLGMSAAAPHWGWLSGREKNRGLSFNYRWLNHTIQEMGIIQCFAGTKCLRAAWTLTWRGR